MHIKTTFVARFGLFVGAVSTAFTAVTGGAMLAGRDSAYGGTIDRLRPHRAVYELSLIKASERAGFSNMTGRIVYEVRGSKCEGFAVRFRFFTKIQLPRKTLTSDQRSTSFESADGTEMSFVNQSYLNGQLEQELKGQARLIAGKTQVELTQPDPEKIKLDASVFATFHTIQLIEAAQKEQKLLSARVFDASDEGDQLLDTLAVIGKRRDASAEVEGEKAAVSKQFSHEAAWPISVSYFSTNEKEAQGEKLPIYQVSFLMHESGVSRDLKMRYQDYALKGDLTHIEYLQAEPCR